jgi:hypothetical protein
VEYVLARLVGGGAVKHRSEALRLLGHSRPSLRHHHQQSLLFNEARLLRSAQAIGRMLRVLTLSTIMTASRFLPEHGVSSMTRD